MNRAAPLDELNLGWQSHARDADAGADTADSDDSCVSNSEEEIVLSSEAATSQRSQPKQAAAPPEIARPAPPKSARPAAPKANKLADILRRVNKPNVRYRAGLSRKVNIDSLHANIKSQTK